MTEYIAEKQSSQCFTVEIEFSVQNLYITLSLFIMFDDNRSSVVDSFPGDQFPFFIRRCDWFRIQEQFFSIIIFIIIFLIDRTIRRKISFDYFSVFFYPDFIRIIDTMSCSVSCNEISIYRIEYRCTILKKRSIAVGKLRNEIERKILNIFQIIDSKKVFTDTG